MHTHQNTCAMHVSQFEVCKQIYTSGFLNQTKLSPSSKLVLIALANHFNPQKKDMFPSQEFISNQLGISIKSVQRAVKELKDAQVLIYDTKRVNHYVFTNIFFERINLSHKKRQTVSSQKDNLSHKHNKEHEKNNKNFKKSSFSYGKFEAPNPAKSVEQTKEEINRSFAGERKSPMDDFETAKYWIENLTPAQMRLSVIEKRAISVCEKWGISLEGLPIAVGT